MLDTGKDAIDVTATVTAKVGEEAVNKGVNGLAAFAKLILKLLEAILRKVADKMANRNGMRKIKTLSKSGDSTSYIELPAGVEQKEFQKQLHKQGKKLAFQFSLTKSGDNYILTFKDKDAQVVALAYKNLQREAIIKNKVMPDIEMQNVVQAKPSKETAKVIEYLSQDRERISALESEIAKQEQYNTQYLKAIDYADDYRTEMQERETYKRLEQKLADMRSNLEQLKVQAAINVQGEHSQEIAKPKYEPIKVSRDQEGNFVYSRGDLSITSKGEKGEVVRQRLQDNFGIGEKSSWAVWNQGMELSKNGKAANRSSINENISRAQEKQQADIQTSKQAPKAMTQSTQKMAPAASMAR